MASRVLKLSTWSSTSFPSGWPGSAATAAAVVMHDILIFGVGLGALSYALAVASKGQDWIFWTVQQTLMFPMLLLAGILLPLEGGPGWMRALSKANPLTYLVDAERALFDGELIDAAVARGVVAGAATCAVGLAVGVRVMRSGTAG